MARLSPSIDLTAIPTEFIILRAYIDSILEMQEIEHAHCPRKLTEDTILETDYY